MANPTTNVVIGAEPVRIKTVRIRNSTAFISTVVCKAINILLPKSFSLFKIVFNSAVNSKPLSLTQSDSSF